MHLGPWLFIYLFCDSIFLIKYTAGETFVKDCFPPYVRGAENHGRSLAMPPASHALGTGIEFQPLPPPPLSLKIGAVRWMYGVWLGEDLLWFKIPRHQRVWNDFTD